MCNAVTQQMPTLQPLSGPRGDDFVLGNALAWDAVFGSAPFPADFAVSSYTTAMFRCRHYRPKNAPLPHSQVAHWSGSARAQNCVVTRLPKRLALQHLRIYPITVN